MNDSVYTGGMKKAIPWQDRLHPEPNSGCWLWEGAQTRGGYGCIRIHIGRRKGIMKKVHRLAYEEAYGPIPDGLWVLHHCDVPACCNPAHLYVGTRADNTRDLIARKGPLRGQPFLNTLKTHCPKGHSYTDANTYVWGGMRHCLKCNAEAQQRYQAKKREAAL
jgi:hypothetical protein